MDLSNRWEIIRETQSYIYTSSLTINSKLICLYIRIFRGKVWEVLKRNIPLYKRVLKRACVIVLPILTAGLVDACSLVLGWIQKMYGNWLISMQKQKHYYSSRWRSWRHNGDTAENKLKESLKMNLKNVCSTEKPPMTVTWITIPQETSN